MTAPEQTEELNPLSVGLFGTCGGSRWREPFTQAFDPLGIPYFNPQVDNWTPELADLEAWHLANDRLILFPVTDETFAFGSLAESGFSIQSACSLNATRFVVIYIEPDVCQALKVSSPEQADASRRARKLALSHLKKVSNPNVFYATSLDDMRVKALKLYAALELLESVRATEPGWRSQMSPQAWMELVLGTADTLLEAGATTGGKVAA